MPQARSSSATSPYSRRSGPNHWTHIASVESTHCEIEPNRPRQALDGRIGNPSQDRLHEHVTMDHLIRTAMEIGNHGGQRIGDAERIVHLGHHSVRVSKP